MSRRHAYILVRADEDEDDCLTAAAESFIVDHPELDGYDLKPRWADDADRTWVALTVPAVELADNGKEGDARVRLIVAPCDGGRDVYLETNGGPMLVQQEENASACSVEQAAEALGMSPHEVYDLVISAFPECDWSEPES